MWRNLKHLQRNTTYPPLHAARNVSQREAFDTGYVGRIEQANVDIFRDVFKRVIANTRLYEYIDRRGMAFDVLCYEVRHHNLYRN